MAGIGYLTSRMAECLLYARASVPGGEGELWNSSSSIEACNPSVWEDLDRKMR